MSQDRRKYITRRLGEDPLEVYRQLNHVSPVDRTEIVLMLIEEHGRLELPEQDGAKANLTGLDLSREGLRHSVLLRGGEARWWDEDGHRVELRGANLQGAQLRWAKLQRADLRDANLQEANLWEANIQGADLRRANLYHVYTVQTSWGETRLHREQLGEGIGEEALAYLNPEQRPAETPKWYKDLTRTRLHTMTARAYLDLERNFSSIGDHEAVDWAYRKRRIMEKMAAWTNAKDEAMARKWTIAIRQSLKATTDYFIELVCGYGESVTRVLITLTFLFFTFTLGYGVFGAVVRIDGRHLALPYDWVDLVTFSLNTMTNTDTGPIRLADDNLARFTAGLQTLLTIFLIGLLGFVVGNRVRRS
jgi:uncharacterized protein YjbI with pentapeptide repeats